MKRFILILVAFASLGAALAQAQVKPSALISQKGQLLDEYGTVYSAADIKEIIGEDIFNETYLGATKQYRAGKSLITWGAVGMGVGLVTATLGYVSVGVSQPYVTWESYALVYSGLIIATLGETALAVGIPLKCIGRSRLNWIAEDYNGKASRVTLNVTGCRNGYGLGLALNF